MFKPIDERKVILYLLALVNFVHIVDFMLLMPLGEFLMRSFDITPTAFSWLVASYTLSAGVSGFLGAFWLDKKDKRKVLLWTFLGFTICTLLCAWSPSFWHLLVARSATGFFGGVTTALIITMASELFPYRERGYAMGILSAAFSVAAVIGVPFGLFLATTWNWRVPFVLLSVLCMVVFILLIKKLPSFAASEEGKNTRNIDVIKNVLQDKNQLIALLLGFIIVLGHFMIIPFLTPFLIRNVQFSETSISLMYMIGGGLTIFTAPIIGRWTDKLGAVKMMYILMIISIIPVLLLTHMGVSSAWYVLIITSLFFIFGSGRMIPAQTLITGAVNPESRGSFMSFRSAIQQIATSLGAVFAGWLLHQHIDGTIQGFATLGIVAIGVSLLALIPVRFIKIVPD
jgi:predicted MFS family arabinose efflux permease